MLSPDKKTDPETELEADLGPDELFTQAPVENAAVAHVQNI